MTLFSAHHIDSDPTNNDLLNLIPLCPNCHILDQHDPTAEIDRSKLRLFRQYRNPTILAPQFQPLFHRLKFLDEIEDDTDIKELQRNAQELISFVADLEMGTFYSERIADLTRKPKYASITIIGDPVSEARRRDRLVKEAQEYRDILRTNRDAVIALVVELLRFQSWQPQQ